MHKDILGTIKSGMYSFPRKLNFPPTLYRNLYLLTILTAKYYRFDCVFGLQPLAPFLKNCGAKSKLKEIFEIVEFIISKVKTFFYAG